MMGSFPIETSSSSLAQFHSEDCSAALGQVSLHRHWAGNWALCYWQMCFLSLSSGLATQVALAASIFNIWMFSPARVGVSVNFKAAGLIFFWRKQTWNMSYGSFYLNNCEKGFAKAGENEWWNKLAAPFSLFLFFWFNYLSPCFLQVWRGKHGAHNQVAGKAQGPPWQLCAWHWDWEWCFTGWVGWYFAKFVYFFYTESEQFKYSSHKWQW